MVFASITFLIYFLPLFLLTYFLSGQKLKNGVLLAFSIFFYAWGEPIFIFILILWTLINYLVLKKSHEAKEGKRKLLIKSSVVFTLLLLVVYKYLDFIVGSLNPVIESIGLSIPAPEIALPIGISFFTFQSISYSIDIYRKQADPVKSYSDYLLYISMFPQLLAGPIVRFKEVSAQIRNRNVTNEKIAIGFFRFCVGLSKKVLIADILGQYVDTQLAQGVVGIESFTSWLILLSYSFQIYFDFSGYSDMAIGLGLMMGFRFPENFNYPYLSKSITEFWRRWHITLGNWMKDYLYIPLGGNKISVTRTYINLWLVFLLSGLWHGASWNFVIWGGFHGIFLVIERFTRQKINYRFPAIISMLYCFFVVINGWVLFRIEKLSEVFQFYKTLYSFNFDKVTLPESSMLTVLVLAFFFSLVPFFNWKSIDTIDLARWSMVKKLRYVTGSILLLYLSIAFLTSNGFSPFIYYRF